VTGALSLSTEFDRAKVANAAQGGYHIHTGNTIVDFIYPIFEGTAARVEGGKSSGKTTLGLNAVKRFLATSDNCHVVYFTSSTSEAQKAIHFLAASPKRFLTIVPRDPGSDSSVYLNILAVAKQAINLKSQGKRVMVVIDNLQSPLTASLQISKDLGSIFVWQPII
jgi:F0F1-type ATP synthase alpha subunit